MYLGRGRKLGGVVPSCDLCEAEFEPPALSRVSDRFHSFLESGKFEPWRS